MQALKYASIGRHHDFTPILPTCPPSWLDASFVESGTADVLIGKPRPLHRPRLRAKKQL